MKKGCEFKLDRAKESQILHEKVHKSTDEHAHEARKCPVFTCSHFYLFCVPLQRDGILTIMMFVPYLSFIRRFHRLMCCYEQQNKDGTTAMPEGYVHPLARLACTFLALTIEFSSYMHSQSILNYFYSNKLHLSKFQTFTLNIFRIIFEIVSCFSHRVGQCAPLAPLQLQFWLRQE